MFYARLDVTPGAMFDEAILNWLYCEPEREVPELQPRGMARFRRDGVPAELPTATMARSCAGTPRTVLQPKIGAELYSRNQLINESVEVFENRSADTTDILHEYFVPLGGIRGFVEAAGRDHHAGRRRPDERHGALRRRGPGQLSALRRPEHARSGHAVPSESATSGENAACNA